MTTGASPLNEERPSHGDVRSGGRVGQARQRGVGGAHREAHPFPERRQRRDPVRAPGERYRHLRPMGIGQGEAKISSRVHVQFDQHVAAGGNDVSMARAARAVERDPPGVGEKDAALARLRVPGAKMEVGRGQVGRRGPVHSADHIEEGVGVEIEAQRPAGGGGDVGKIGAVSANDDALELVWKGKGVRGGRIDQSGELEPGDPWSQGEGARLIVVGDVGRGGIDIQHGHQSFLAQIIPLPATGPGVGEEASDVEFGVVESHREPARLEGARTIGIVGDAVAQIHVPDDRASGGVDHRDRILATAGHEHAPAIDGIDDVPRFGAGGERPDNRRAERAPGGVADLYDRNRARGGIGHIGPLVVRSQRHALGLVANGELGQDRMGVRPDDTDAVVGRVHHPDEPVIRVDGDRAGVGGPGPRLGQERVRDQSRQHDASPGEDGHRMEHRMQAGMMHRTSDLVGIRRVLGRYGERGTQLSIDSRGRGRGMRLKRRFAGDSPR